jgi:hypothetical protein
MRILPLQSILAASALCLVLGLGGCSHVHTLSMPAAPAQNGPKVPVDLGGFWKENGFTLVSQASEAGKTHYRANDGGRVVAVWEKWFKGVVFKYSGGMYAKEVLKNGRYEIRFVPVASTRDVDTTKMAQALQEYLATNHPGIQVGFDSQGFVDLR